MHRNRVSAGWLLAGAMHVSGCATMQSHWPFGKAAPASPQPVSELELRLPPKVRHRWCCSSGSATRWWWDLQNVASTGQVVLARKAGNLWPARIAVRMAPQRFEMLEVRGAQRLLLPVAAGSGAVTAQLPPDLHDQATATLTISWGARSAF